MNTLLKKLNFKNFKEILILNHPLEFQKQLNEITEFTAIHTEIKKIETIDFVITFITKQSEIESMMKLLSSKLSSDAIVWFSYPKGTSKKYTFDFNRDRGWECMGKYNFEPVRQIAIDEDWSSLRFRNVKHIKKLTRSSQSTLTEEAKKRTENNPVKNK